MSSIIPEKIIKYVKKIYNGILDDKEKIKKDNDKKSGIYCLLNKVNSKIYVGRSKDLKRRAYVYMSPSYYKNREFTLLKRSIIKYGLINFSFIILEYTTQNDLVYMRQREQYWINLLKPELNLILKADSNATSDLLSKGHKHTIETKEYLRKIALMRVKDHNPGFSVKVKNIETGEINKYKSIREAARVLKADTRSIRVRIIKENEANLLLRRNNISEYNKKLFRKKYIIYLNK